MNRKTLFDKPNDKTYRFLFFWLVHYNAFVHIKITHKFSNRSVKVNINNNKYMNGMATKLEKSQNN